MYFGSRYTSTQVVTALRVFTCRQCGHSEPVLVVGVGTGQGVSPFFLDRSGAAQRATEEARGDAQRNLDVTLGLCPCPRCGTRSAISGFALKCVFTVALVAVLGPVIGAAAGVMRAKFGWIFWPLGVVLAVVVYLSGFHATWARARERVRFGLSRAELAKLGTNAADADEERERSDDEGLDAPPRPGRGRFDGMAARARLRAQARERVRRAAEQGPASRSSFEDTGAVDTPPEGEPAAAAKRRARREELRKRARERTRGRAKGEQSALRDDDAPGAPAARDDEPDEHGAPG